jgi:hypothetical protein
VTIPLPLHSSSSSSSLLSSNFLLCQRFNTSTSIQQHQHQHQHQQPPLSSHYCRLRSNDQTTTSVAKSNDGVDDVLTTLFHSLSSVTTDIGSEVNECQDTTSSSLTQLATKTISSSHNNIFQSVLERSCENADVFFIVICERGRVYNSIEHHILRAHRVFLLRFPFFVQRFQCSDATDRDAVRYVIPSLACESAHVILVRHTAPLSDVVDALRTILHYCYTDTLQWHTQTPERLQIHQHLVLDFSIKWGLHSLISLIHEFTNHNSSIRTTPPPLTTSSSQLSLLEHMAHVLRSIKDANNDSTLFGADVKLVCAERTLRAHSYILTARSEYFAAMLSHPFIESHTRIVHFPDISSEVTLFPSFTLSKKKFNCFDLTSCAWTGDVRCSLVFIHKFSLTTTRPTHKSRAVLVESRLRCRSLLVDRTLHMGTRSSCPSVNTRQCVCSSSALS